MEISHKDGSVIYTELKGRHVLDKVDFSYDGTKLVLDDVSVYARRPKNCISLARQAGKTTITNLINRFYDLADTRFVMMV